MADSQTDLFGYSVPSPGELRIIRDTLSISRDEVSDCLGFNTRTISKWESGDTSPTLEDLEKLLAYYRARAVNMREIGEVKGEVYSGFRGEFFHKSKKCATTYDYMERHVVSMEVEEAQEKGLEPCSNCIR